MIAPERPPLRAPKGEPMRWVICAVFVLGLAPSAFADDLNVLRGTQSVGPALYTRWSGFYFGGQVNYSDGHVDFSKATEPLVGGSLLGLSLESIAMPSTLPILSNSSVDKAGAGGFVGYNTQWQDLILGVEANYTHAPFTAVSSVSPIVNHVYTINSDLVSVNLTGTGVMEVTDYGSLRLRAGWILDNYFLPYGFAGLALGRANYSVTSTVFGQQSSSVPPALPCTPNGTTCLDYYFPNATSGNGVILYGFSIGGGIDIALTSNIFVRGEYEYIEFAEVNNIIASISTVRLGAGLKF